MNNFERLKFLVKQMKPALSFAIEGSYSNQLEILRFVWKLEFFLRFAILPSSSQQSEKFY